MTFVRAFAVPLLTAWAAFADTQFRAAAMKRLAAPVDRAQCDIRLRIDGEAEVTLRGDLISVHTLSGRDARNAGSECSQPLPNRDVRSFAFEALDHSDDIHLVAQPSPANDFEVLVRIRNPGSGDQRYHFRVTWQLAAAGPPGFAWNNATRYKARGHGELTVGSAHLELLDADVAIDLGGKVWVTFGKAKKERLSFSGVLNEREGGRLRADVVCDGPEWHVQGPMFLSVDQTHDRVTAITLDATDGRDRMHLEWKRR